MVLFELPTSNVLTCRVTQWHVAQFPFSVWIRCVAPGSVDERRVWIATEVVRQPNAAVGEQSIVASEVVRMWRLR